MGEALAATGSAVGIVSLGITVCGGLVKYYDSWKDHDEDVAATYSYVKSLEDVLETLQSVLNRGKFRSELSDQVERHIVVCAGGLQWLKAKWDKIKNDEVPLSRRSKFTIEMRKGLYPFKEKTLSKVQRTTSELRENLRLALNVLGIDTAAENHAALGRIEPRLIQTQDIMLRSFAAVNTAAQDVDRVGGDLAQVGNIVMEVKRSMLTREQYEKTFELHIERLIAKLQTSQQRKSQKDLFSETFTTLSTEMTATPYPESASFPGELRMAGSNSSTDQRLALGPIHTAENHPCSISRPKIDLDSIQLKACTCIYHPTNHQTSSEQVSLASTQGRGSYRHAKNCPVHNQFEGKKIKLVSDWRLPLRFLAKTLSISCSLAYGGGGFSLEPVFRVHHVIDEGTSPAFVAIRQYFWDLPYNPQSFTAVVIQGKTQALLEYLLELHVDGRCSPLYISECGQDLLEYVTSEMRFNVTFCMSSNVGAPDFSIGYVYSKFFGFLIGTLHYPISRLVVADVMGVDTRLLGYGSQSMSSNPRSELAHIDDLDLCGISFPMGATAYMPDVIREWPGISELLDLDPFIRAVIDRSPQNLEALVRCNHLPCNPVLTDGQSLLHSAVGWPQGLGILLSAGADPGVGDGCGRLPLHYAFAKRCLQSATLLLSWNSPFTEIPKHSWSKLRWGKDPFGSLDSCPKEYQEYVVNHLVKRRRVLQEELTNILESMYDTSILHLNKTAVLDEIGLPLILLAGIPESRWKGLLGADTVYHYEDFQWNRLRNTLFEHGFHDINAYDRNGLTPLMIACMNGNHQGAQWFLQRGCSPLSRDAFDQYNAFLAFVKQWNSVTALATIPYFVASAASGKAQKAPSRFYWSWHSSELFNGFPDNWTRKRREAFLNQLVEEYRPSFVSVHSEQESLIGPGCMTELQQRKGTKLLLSSNDSCNYLCAPEGCTGTTLVLRDEDDHEALFFRDPRPTLDAWCAVFGTVQAINFIHRDYIRLCVFEALEMTHTCCYTWDDNFDPRVSEADELEIQEEEAELADKLEAFMKKYDEAFAANEGDIMDFVEEWEDRIYSIDPEYLYVDVENQSKSLQEAAEVESSNNGDHEDESSGNDQEASEEEGQDQESPNGRLNRATPAADPSEQNPREAQFQSQQKPARRNSW